MNAVVAKVTTGSKIDPRLATEEELRFIIEEMNPGDLDLDSPAFQELPVPIQYEIVGDLRLKSRQTSYKRLRTMVQKSKTPLDFSKAQIVGLKQRNTLTQQLLETTGIIGQAHIAIPTRVAQERGRKYLLVKNPDHEIGFVLAAAREVGSSAKPIEIDQDEKEGNDNEIHEDDSDSDMEEVVMYACYQHNPHSDY